MFRVGTANHRWPGRRRSTFGGDHGGHRAHPIGPELARRNRRILGERLRWPTGAVEACEQIEAESPAWWVTWANGGGMTWTNSGFYAHRRNWHVYDSGPRWVYGTTADELRGAIADNEPPDRWSHRC